jgi:iron(III) transport system substrate-binding protein
MRRLLPVLPLLAIALVACGSGDTPAASSDRSAASKDAGTLNIYSARHYDSDRILYDTFEKQTGIKVSFRESKAPQLLETLKAEGDASPADVIIAADAGTLYRFQTAGLTQPIESEVINTVIPARFREENNHWVGLAKRARVIVYDPARLDPEDVDDYTDLASGKLQGEICMRSSTNIYNLSLMGELIERLGQDTAKAWARSVVANFARQPQGGDTTQIESIAAGECSVALVNHYYYVRLAQSESEAKRTVAAKTRLAFPGQTGNGTHINVTAAAITANAPSKDNAVRFIEFLTTPEGQSLLTTETKEFPIIAGITPPAGVENLPMFKESDMSLTRLGERQSDAQTVFDTAGWN